MGMYDDDDDDRDLPKKLRQQIKDRDKALEEKDQELAALRAKDQQRTVADAFGAKGVNPRFARLALAEVDVVSEESLTAWIEANADLVGVQPAPPQQVQPDPAEDPYRRMAAVEQGAQPGIPGSGSAQLAAMSGEELDAMLSGGAY
jgi:hypothetical protein